MCRARPRPFRRFQFDRSTHQDKAQLSGQRPVKGRSIDDCILVQCLTKGLTIESLVSFPRRRESRSDTRWISCQARNNTLYRYYDDTTLDPIQYLGRSEKKEQEKPPAGSLRVLTQRRWLSRFSTPPAVLGRRGYKGFVPAEGLGCPPISQRSGARRCRRSSCRGLGCPQFLNTSPKSGGQGVDKTQSGISLARGW
jgi:hypothetical protein